ncbi:hypothetical protein GOP47_0010077 [Adiantum capillus-veneris]|uniref:shikimate dehydrogenase (NADP(+)) n=1 Tax=Adiantum capillus-veneris TaxID=13818 RepID=A0A9D4UUF3_ADICA|nr:hypothetical protein GOP47_0010077 [Adiantum capillus-veneris]
MVVGENGCHLCAPLVAKSAEEMREQMHLAHLQGADIVELRLDHIAHFNPLVDLPLLLKDRPLPAIVTYRPTWEGGEYVGDEAARLDALRLAMNFGADFIDVELKAAPEFIANLQDKKSTGCKILVSNHNFEMTPSAESIGSLVAKIVSCGADIVKFVTTAQKITDVATVFQILARCQVPTIALVMGQSGLISRLLSPKYGGFLTFGSLASGKESASGQPTLSDLRNIYSLGRVNRQTKVFGIIGKPVGHSKSPIIHNAAFREIGYDGIYVPFLVDNLREFLNVYNTSDFSGFSVTIPHKEAALECCDEVDPLAKAVGAVNTIVRRKSDGKLIGYNTDCEGAISAIEDGLRGGESNTTDKSPLSGRYFVVIGAGGAGKALAYGAKSRGAKVFIANRSYERAKVLADALGGEALSLEQLNTFQPVDGMVLANTTSVGMSPNIAETPIAKDALRKYSLVFDAVYTPRITRLLTEAEESGAEVVSGLEMFIRQAIKQFSLFTGGSAPEKLMRDMMANTL